MEKFQLLKISELVPNIEEYVKIAEGIGDKKLISLWHKVRNNLIEIQKAPKPKNCTIARWRQRNPK
jgi:hypothetical protein